MLWFFLQPPPNERGLLITIPNHPNSNFYTHQLQRNNHFMFLQIQNIHNNPLFIYVLNLTPSHIITLLNEDDILSPGDTWQYEMLFEMNRKFSQLTTKYYGVDGQRMICFLVFYLIFFSSPWCCKFNFCHLQSKN